MNTQSNMKMSRIFYSMLLVAMTAFFSCTKENGAEVDAATSVTEDDAAEVITQSISPESGGLAVHLQNSARICHPDNLAWLAASCGIPKDSTVSGSGSGTGPVSWSYSFSWNWLLSCELGIPHQFDLGFHGNTYFDGPRMTSEDTSYATLVVTGLAPAFTEVTVNGNLVRSGTKISKIRRQLTFTSDASFTLTDVKVNKISKKITSGTLEVHITGSTSAGKTFEYNATIELTGYNSCRLRFRSGRIFNIFW